MAEYTGKLKDVSAIDLGAIASPAALTRTGVAGRRRRPRRVRQRVAEQRQRRLRGAPYRVEGRPAGGSAGADGQPALRLGHPGGDQRRADDSAGRGGPRADRRDREHEPDAARDPRLAQRAAARTRALEDTLWSALLDTHCGCTMAATAENCAAKYGISREAQDAYAVRSQQLAARAWADGRFEDEVVPVETEDAHRHGAVRPGRPPATRHDDRDAGEAARRLQQERLRDRRQRLRHRRRWRGADPGLGAGGADAGAHADRAPGRVGDGWRRPRPDGNGAGAGHPPGPRSARG